LLLNSTSDFIEIDTLAAIASVGPGHGSGAALAPASICAAERGNQRSKSVLRHDQLITVFS
jgi:hypothetical protein